MAKAEAEEVRKRWEKALKDAIEFDSWGQVE